MSELIPLVMYVRFPASEKQTGRPSGEHSNTSVLLADVLWHSRKVRVSGVTTFLIACIVLAGGCGNDEEAVSASASSGTPIAAAISDTVHAIGSPLGDLAVPDGMVLIPGGTTMIGSSDGFPNEEPAFVAKVQPFFMDVHEVTVAEFERFVEATGYVTQAEVFGNSAMIDERTKRWLLVDGANWRTPHGPDGEPAASDHPVTHVSWNDASAYAAWAGKRLPTEIEWEHAARGAVNDRSRYSPGLAIGPDGFPKANLWQGEFPNRNSGKDGYLYTSSVGSFGTSALGLMDIAGNVWEWTDSWFRPYTDRDRPFTPDEFSARVQRGGSFLCNDSWCHGFRVSARGQSTPESSHYHVGFRCVKDVDV